MHFARLVKQACVDLVSDLFVYYRLGCQPFVCSWGLQEGFADLEQRYISVAVGAKVININTCISVIVGRISDAIRKNCVPQWGIKPWPIHASYHWTTKTLITVTFTPPPPPKEKVCPHPFQAWRSH